MVGMNSVILHRLPRYPHSLSAILLDSLVCRISLQRKHVNGIESPLA